MGKVITFIFSFVDSLLLLTSIGILIYDIVVLAKFTEVVVGPLGGFLVFSIVIQGIILLAVAVGLRAFYIKATMWIFTSNALLCAAMCFTIIGATFFHILAGKTLDNDDGFRRIVSDIEFNFDIQVFNDCCLPLVDELPVGFSLGDIVPQIMCDLLEDNEADSFVGLDENSCGRGGVADGPLVFATFANDFENFTDLFFFPVLGILWFQAILLLLSFLLNCSQLSCSAPKEVHYQIGGGDVDLTDVTHPVAIAQQPHASMAPPPNNDAGFVVAPKAAAPPLPPNKPQPLLPQPVRNYLGNLSARIMPQRADGGSVFGSFYRGPPSHAPDGGPPIPPRGIQRFVQAISSKFQPPSSKPPAPTPKVPRPPNHGNNGYNRPEDYL